MDRQISRLATSSNTTTRRLRHAPVRAALLLGTGATAPNTGAEMYVAWHGWLRRRLRGRGVNIRSRLVSLVLGITNYGLPSSFVSITDPLHSLLRRCCQRDFRRAGPLTPAVGTRVATDSFPFAITSLIALGISGSRWSPRSRGCETPPRGCETPPRGDNFCVRCRCMTRRQLKLSC